MVISLLKNEQGFITGFISHIMKPWLYDKTTLREIQDRDYGVLLLFLTGRDYVRESNKFPTAVIGSISLKDEGDFAQEHLKIQKRVFELDKEHLVNK